MPHSFETAPVGAVTLVRPPIACEECLKTARAVLKVAIVGSFLLLLTLPSTSLAQAPAANPLVGAWQTVMFVGDSTRPFRSTPVHPAPELGREGAVTGLRLFTPKHYSVLLLIRTGSRVPLPDSAPTAEQLLNTWAPFAASGGSYELRGDTLIGTPALSKNPRVTTQPSKYLFRVRGDSLFLTASNGVTEIAVRVERGPP
jgi:hypothetical protein